DVAATTASGLTALHGAAERGPEGVELLLRHGADVKVRADNGTTPLHVAARYGRTQAAAVLLAAGADPSSRAVSGKTPLDLARDRGHVSTLQLLENAARTR
ncbi:MAG: ankyrin repeat domain-containing protein, partial [Candidatus Hydrogenedentes bacterium]|nr:ankyrin repeat domain-containing protein [Candidatus Hydrogenedentota bacterium]